MINDNRRAARGEGGSSSLQSGDPARKDGVDVDAGATMAPVIDSAWDPYQVWLTRVKQPREQSHLQRRKPKTTVEKPASTDISDTARLRALIATPTN